MVLVAINDGGRSINDLVAGHGVSELELIELT